MPSIQSNDALIMKTREGGRVIDRSIAIQCIFINVILSFLSVNLVSCMGGFVEFHITDCQDGGIVYLRSQEVVSNVQESVNGTMTYTCSMRQCLIEWVRRVKLIIVTYYTKLHKVFLLA